MHESSAGFIASESCNSWIVKLLYEREKTPEKRLYAHLGESIYAMPFAGPHFNTAGRMEWVA